MSAERCLLGRLPVELLHIVFDHLSTYDILYGFLNISPYVNRVVASYHHYQVNLRSIVKHEFDFICDHVNPSNVISLTLSNGSETPGQIDLFLSFFQLEQFHSTLRSLSLCDINADVMQKIFAQIDRFTHLVSLSVIDSTGPVPLTFTQLLPQLVQCRVPQEWLTGPSVDVTQLKRCDVVDQCNCEQFITILSRCPKLISLNLTLQDDFVREIDPITSNLTRLVLNMSRSHLNMHRLKQILMGHSRLLHLEIEARTDLETCDGHQWESFISTYISGLRTFNFKFQLKATLCLNKLGIENLLASFSTPYWLFGKRWFIALEWEQRLVYTVPRYSRESADPNFRPPMHCTAPDETIFYDHITALAIWGPTTHRFNQVQELWIVDSPERLDLEHMIDVDRVQSLIIVGSKTDLTIDTLINLIERMPSLNYVQFFDIPASFEQKTSSLTAFERIRRLEIVRESQSFEYYQMFGRLFPRLERLRTTVQKNQDIEHILKIFSPNLSIVFFECDVTRLSITRAWIEKIIGHCNFTHILEPTALRLWIGLDKTIKETKSVRKHNRHGCFSWCSSARHRLAKR